MLWNTPLDMARQDRIRTKAAKLAASGMCEIGGNTYPHRDALRTMGGRPSKKWDAGKRKMVWVWLVPKEKREEAVALVSQPVQSEGQRWADRYEDSPESWPGMQPGGY